MPHPEKYTTIMVGLLNPYLLRGIYIGSVFTSRGVELYVVEKQDGQCFVGVKGSVAIIKEAENAQQEAPKEGSRRMHG
jgi:hypothetical protein